MTEGFIGEVQGNALRDSRTVVRIKGLSFVRKCPICEKPIHFIVTVAKRKMPCELDIKRGDGKMTLITHEGVTHRKAGDTVFGYEPHFGHCKKVDQKGGAQ